MRCPRVSVGGRPFLLRRDAFDSLVFCLGEMFFLRSPLERSSQTSEQSSSTVSPGLLGALDGSDTLRTQVALVEYVYFAGLHPPLSICFLRRVGRVFLGPIFGRRARFRWQNKSWARLRFLPIGNVRQEEFLESITPPPVFVFLPRFLCHKQW